MKRLSSFKLAILLGVLVEVVFAVMMALGRSGPCGPDSSLGMLLVLFHYPGAVLASPICEHSDPSHASLPLIIAMLVMWSTGALMLTGLFYIPIRFIRWIGKAKDDAGAVVSASAAASTDQGAAGRG